VTEKLPPERRADVDLMRALLVFGLILFHSARIFDLLPFYIKNDRQSMTLMVFVGFVSQFGMPLFFVIAGIAAWHALNKRTPPEFARDRFRRLVIPLIFGIFVLVPPQHYYSSLTNPDFHESYWQFYPSFFRVVLKLDFPEFVRADPAVGLFGPAHLWFLWYLFVYSMLALPLFVYLKRESGRRWLSRLASLCTKPGAIFLLALPVIVIETFVLLEEEPTGWNRYAYLPFLICGFLFASDKRFEQALLKHRNVALIGGVLSVLGFFAITAVTYLAHIDPSRGYGWQNILWRLLKSCSSFFWIVAILGWAQRLRHLLSHRGSLKLVAHRSMMRPAISSYINEAVMPFYIIHQTVIVVIGFYIVKWNAGVTIKYLVVITATFLITLLLYDLIVRRANPIRFLFGMKPKRQVPSALGSANQ
jgi:glucans biosynthesis protein C